MALSYKDLKFTSSGYAVTLQKNTWWRKTGIDFAQQDLILYNRKHCWRRTNGGELTDTVDELDSMDNSVQSIQGNACARAADYPHSLSAAQPVSTSVRLLCLSDYIPAVD